MLLVYYALIFGAFSTTLRNQISHATYYDRYPHVFAEVHRLSKALMHDRVPKILSFGSSTGLEAVTLSRYFHASIIVGADVDDQTLSAARDTCAKANVSDRCFFFNDEKMPLDSLGMYDIVFANSVLCRHPWDHNRTAADWYPFERFQETIKKLNQVLREGGILVMINTNYRFDDTSVARAYRTAPVGNCTRNRVPLFTPAGGHLPPRDVCVFTKRHVTYAPLYAPRSIHRQL